MDKYDIMSMLAECFAGLTAEEQIENRAFEIIEAVFEMKEMAKQYLKAGLLWLEKEADKCETQTF